MGLFFNKDKSNIKRLEKMADKVMSLEATYASKTDEELANMTNVFKEALAGGKSLDNILPDAFAVVREAAKRTLGMTPFKVQVMGGIVLHEGNVAEMKTGEGKTLTCTMPVYLNALTGKGVHVVTVNDYLAKRDAEWMSAVYNFLGMSVGCITNDKTSGERKEAYACDITYGTNSEYGFDYLRDNMASNKDAIVQREYNFALIDEADSILIDEARTPHIIAGQTGELFALYHQADTFAKSLAPEDYTIEEKDHQISLNESGSLKAERCFGIDNLYDVANLNIFHHVNAALKANYILKKDVDYIIQNDEVLLVDVFTGRVQPGRRFSDGLHQAIEAKENVDIKEESRTLASITLQNYFRMYNKIAGMTGTAKTEEEEFVDIYNMNVIEIPTNKPCIRKDLEDSVYLSENGKWTAIVREIERIHKTGQPILIGTVSVEKSEFLSEKLNTIGIRHEVLNAKYHEKEAQIVADAGKLNQVTIATNMAGRGTDIVLGGKDATKEEADMVKSLGGLYIIGTERHEARRIDNQLRGRAGRQGDPGCTQFFVSIEDDVIRVFAGDKIKAVLGNVNYAEDAPIEKKMLTKMLETAQKKIESKHYDIRKYVLQFDDVVNKQRSVIYQQRRDVLMSDDIMSILTPMFAKCNIPEAVYMAKINEIPEELRNSILKSVLLGTVDFKWESHLENIEALKMGIGLQSIGGEDPVRVFNNISSAEFNEMVNSIITDTVQNVLNLQVSVATTPSSEIVD